jgi:hypothetical protein
LEPNRDGTEITQILSARRKSVRKIDIFEWEGGGLLEIFDEGFFENCNDA